eukprot:12508347-Alexandrium_andersonii.AAC.1
MGIFRHPALLSLLQRTGASVKELFHSKRRHGFIDGLVYRLDLDTQFADLQADKGSWFHDDFKHPPRPGRMHESHRSQGSFLALLWREAAAHLDSVIQPSTKIYSCGVGGLTPMLSHLQQNVSSVPMPALTVPSAADAAPSDVAVVVPDSTVCVFEDEVGQGQSGEARLDDAEL